MNKYSDINIKEEIKNFLGKDGILSKNFPNYEYRDSQLKMALAIADSFENKTHLFIEAPTGIGKSFAYLVAAILYAKKYNKKAVISTHTINLQEQLISNDIPILQEFLPVEFKANLMKGKTNYLCPKRLKKAYENSNSLFETPEINTLKNIYQWSKTTKDGTISDINFNVDYNVWQNVCAEINVCTNKTCGGIKDTECFYQKAKFKIAESDVIILNHYLFFTLSSISSNNTKEGYLFLNDFVIFDEGHTLENAASEQAVPKVSREMIKFQLLRLYNDKRNKGLLTNYPALHIIPVVQNLLDMNQMFFYELRRKVFTREFEKYDKLAKRIFDKKIINNSLQDEIKKLINNLIELRKFAKTEIDENEISDFVIKFSEINSLINNFLNLEFDDYVYWIELSSHLQDSNISLCASPIDISEYLREKLFKPDNSCIITSATLSINENFNYYKQRLGGETADAISLPSQFDFYRQAKIYIPKDIKLLPQKENSESYSHTLEKWILHFIKITKGKALVLFTNSIIMKSVGENIRQLLYETGIDIYIQGEGISRKNLLDEFRKNINSVLFGLESFWLGVDVPGESLSNLIITRLPFIVPDHPLTKARLDYIDANGGNSFMDYSLPEAILKFRQGIGRLIRNKTDEGIIAILDYRILTKAYGKHFLNSLEACPVEIIE